jgi:hypothetical protein
MVSAAGLILMLSIEVADCGDGCEESVTLIVADVVPAAPEAGVPLIVPLELLIDKPPGKFVAVKL